MIIDLSETEKANFRQEFIKRLKRITRETQIHCFPGNTAIGHELAGSHHRRLDFHPCMV